MNYTKTRAVQVAIGERRKRQPGGQPGYLRVDTVHQGDQDGSKGVYHINAVDEVTQWQVIGSVAAITQTHLEPVLRAILGQFPFLIRGFHSDNGSEFINDSVSGLLKRLLIEQTKSRPRLSFRASVPVRTAFAALAWVHSPSGMPSIQISYLSNFGGPLQAPDEEGAGHRFSWRRQQQLQPVG